MSDEEDLGAIDPAAYAADFNARMRARLLAQMGKSAPAAGGAAASDRDDVSDDSGDSMEGLAEYRRILRQGPNAEQVSDSDDDGVQKASPVQPAKKKRYESTSSKDDPQRLERTLFVGNWPVSADEKVLRQHFTSCGAIESTRFRSISFTTAGTPRKYAFAKKQFREDRPACNAYVVFEAKESVAKAIRKKHNSVVEGRHLALDTALPSVEHDHTHSVFVGNVPFDADEEIMRQSFVPFGGITLVRIVRDRKTNMGKGIAYVHFKSKRAAQECVKAAATQPLTYGEEKHRLRVTRAKAETARDSHKPQLLAPKKVFHKPAKPTPGPSESESDGDESDKPRAKQPRTSAAKSSPAATVSVTAGPASVASATSWQGQTAEPGVLFAIKGSRPSTSSSSTAAAADSPTPARSFAPGRYDSSDRNRGGSVRGRGRGGGASSERGRGGFSRGRGGGGFSRGRGGGGGGDDGRTRGRGRGRGRGGSGDRHRSESDGRGRSVDEAGDGARSSFSRGRGGGSPRGRGFSGGSSGGFGRGRGGGGDRGRGRGGDDRGRGRGRGGDDRGRGRGRGGGDRGRGEGGDRGRGRGGRGGGRGRGGGFSRGRGAGGSPSRGVKRSFSNE